MKIFALTTFCIGLVAKAHGSPGLRVIPAHTARQLQVPDWPWAFLVSHVKDDEQWCIEAKHGTATGANIGISPCNFDRNNDKQLWLLDEDGKIHSKLDENQCLIVDNGTGISSGSRILFASCNTPTDYNKFTHDKTTDQIQVKQNPSYCLKQVGPSPQLSDTIRTERCTDKEYFTYTYRDSTCSPTSADVDCCDDNDCPGSDNTCIRSSYECLKGKANECTRDSDCSSGRVCDNGSCVVPECTRDSDCPSGQRCINNNCENINVAPSQGAVFLVSQDDDNGDKCVTASFGIGEFVEVGYESCDFSRKPSDQLWHIENDQTIRSDIDKSRCLVVGPGTDLFGGLKIHIAACDLNRFDYDTRSGHIKLVEDRNYCLTPVGEKIAAKTCFDEDRYKFDQRAP